MSNDNVVVGFVGLGTMGGRMAANCKGPVSSWSSTTCTGRRLGEVPRTMIKVWAPFLKCLECQWDKFRPNLLVSY